MADTLTALDATAASALELGRWRLDRRIGRGGYGEVWRGVERERGLPVAVKVLRADVPAEERAMLAQEARIVASLDHPGIVRVVDVGEVSDADAAASGGALSAGAPWLAMELHEGASLATEAGVIAWPRLRDLLLQVLDALAHAHAHGLVHRDLKAANVLRDRSGERAVLTDFGVAAWVGAPGDDTVRGTPSHMAPEQVRGEWRTLGPWTDLYALGCMTWTLLTGAPPFRGRPHEVLLAHLDADLPALQPTCAIPEGVRAWVARLLEKDPARRYGCAADAAQALRGVEGEAAPGGWPPWRRHDPWHTAHVEVPPGERVVRLRSLRIVGRYAERDALWDALAAVVHTRGDAVVVLRGPSGLGKSRLGTWVGARAHELGLAGMARAVFRAQRADGLVEAVVDACCGDGLDEGALVERIVDASRGEVTRSDAAQLAALALAPEDGTLAQEGWRHALLRRWVRAFAVERPLVLVLDDAQAAPSALRFARRILGPLAGERRTHGVLVVVTIEDEALAADAEANRALTELLEEGARAVPLGPLSDPDQALLARTVLGLAPELAGAVAGATAGNPLHAEQIVAHWLSLDALVPTVRGLAPRADTLPPVPPALSGVWPARVARLLDPRPDPEGAAVEVAAVLGVRFEHDLWTAACIRLGLPVSRTPLDRLAGDRLLQRVSSRGAPEVLAFAHARVRDAIVARADARGRLPRWNAACAEVLADAPVAGARRRRARHLHAAGRWAGAADALLLESRVAIANDESALAAELASLRRDALERDGAVASDPRWGAQLTLEAECAIVCGHDARAQERVDEALERGWVHGWRETVARATGQLARLHTAKGRITEAARAADGAVRAWRKVGDAGEVARARRVQSDLHTASGDLDAADAGFREAAATLRDLGDDAGLGRCALGQSLALRQRGRLTEAVAALEEARACFARCGNRWGAAVCTNDLADLLRVLGDLDAAEQGYRDACAQYQALGVLPLIPDTNRGMLLAERGDHARAVTVFRGLVPYLQGAGREAILVHVQAGLVRSLLLLGLPDEARHHLAPMGAFLEREGLVDPELAGILEEAAGAAGAAGQRDIAGRCAALARVQRAALRAGGAQ